MSEPKWYCHGLTDEDVEGLKKDYAKIENPTYGINDRDQLALEFHLNHANGGGTQYGLKDPNDIMALLKETKAYQVSKLEGKVVEVFLEGCMLKTISVNENIV